MQNYKLTLKDINPKLANEVKQTNKETNKQIKQLKQMQDLNWTKERNILINSMKK